MSTFGFEPLAGKKRDVVLRYGKRKIGYRMSLL